jgi:hypothetical protein
LKYAYPGVILALIVVAAAVCGCASGPAATPVPTGTTASQPIAGPGVAKSGSLFDTGRLKWFEYRLTTSGERGRPAASDIRYDYVTSVINGITVKDDRVTMKVADPGIVLTMDSYYDLVTGRQVGNYRKMVSDDIAVSDRDLAAIDDRYRSSDIAGTFATGDWPLTGTGTGVVIVDGKTYMCTRYSVGSAGEHGTAWVSRDIPVPVKIESISAAEGTSTWELIGWG